VSGAVLIFQAVSYLVAGMVPNVALSLNMLITVASWTFQVYADVAVIAGSVADHRQAGDTNLPDL